MDDDATKEFMELQGQLMENSNKMKQVTAQSRSNDGDKKRAELTIQELEELPSDTVTYRTIGRAFIYVPKDKLQKDMENLAKDLEDNIAKAQTQKEYLEQNQAKIENNLKELVQNSPALMAQFARG